MKKEKKVSKSCFFSALAYLSFGPWRMQGATASMFPMTELFVCLFSQQHFEARHSATSYAHKDYPRGTVPIRPPCHTAAVWFIKKWGGGFWRGNTLALLMTIHHLQYNAKSIERKTVIVISPCPCSKTYQIHSASKCRGGEVGAANEKTAAGLIFPVHWYNSNTPCPPEGFSDGIDNKRLMTIAEKSLSSTTQLISHEIH